MTTNQARSFGYRRIRRSAPTTFRRLPRTWVILVVLTCMAGMNPARAQTDAFEIADGDADTQATDDRRARSDQPGEVTKLSGDEISLLLETLGSKQFAERERAAMALLQQGESILPVLKQISQTSSDPEIKLRASELVKQISRDDLEVRIQQFLSGRDVHMDGWMHARRILGDTGAVRELYVEVVKAHADVASSLDGTDRDRAIAMGAAAARLTRARNIERRFPPSRADAIALLFLAGFDGVPISSDFENELLIALRTNAGTVLYEDPRLTRAYKQLLGRWIGRSSLRIRDEALILAIRNDVMDALPVAVDTLGNTNDPQTLAIALQLIARFGDQGQSMAVANLLDDDRVVIDGFVGGEPSRTQLGDVAMATLAKLNDIPLADVGFKEARLDPKFVFDIRELGFPVDQDELRQRARKKILAIVRQKADTSKNREPRKLLVD